MLKDIRHSFSYNHPPEVVWEYLTDATLLSEWLMPNDIKPVLGHRFTFKTKPMPKFGFDGNVHCVVLEMIPNRKLTYSWKGGMPGQKPVLDTIVVWTLTPTAAGTDVLLEHKGFKGARNWIPYFAMNMGWKKIGKKLRNLINTAIHGTA